MGFAKDLASDDSPSQASNTGDEETVVVSDCEDNGRCLLCNQSFGDVDTDADPSKSHKLLVKMSPSKCQNECESCNYVRLGVFGKSATTMSGTRSSKKNHSSQSDVGKKKMFSQILEENQEVRETFVRQRTKYVLWKQQEEAKKESWQDRSWWCIRAGPETSTTKLLSSPDYV